VRRFRTSIRAAMASQLLTFGTVVLPAAAQLPSGIYPEPIPRAPGVRLPAQAATALAVGSPALGIPDARSFFARQSAVTRREGEFPLIVILAGFADSEDPPVAPDELQRLIFDGPSPRGTLTEYYDEVSRGRLRVTGTVTPWLRTSVPIVEAAGEQAGHGWIGPRMREYVAEAIRLADAHVDFGAFDNDGPDGVPNSGDDDGRVDGVAIKYGEISGSCGGPAPWPHFGAALTAEAEAVETEDRSPAGQPIRVGAYIADSAMECTGTEPDGIQVLAHEFGHLIGLPDLYRLYDGNERENRAWTVGCFDLMAAGAWGCGTGPQIPHFGPTHLSPFMKWRLGWLDFIDVEHAEGQEFVLEPGQTSATALRVRLAPNSLEWFIVEYRPRTGFDQPLPASGVLIYHYDALEGLRPVPGDLPLAFGYHLVEADANDGLRRSEITGGNRGEAGDVFARDGEEATIGDASNPSTRDHLGAPSTVTVHSIRVDGGVARITLSAGTGFHVAARELPERIFALDTVDARIRVADGAPPFTTTNVAGALPEGLSAAIVDDALRITGRPRQAGTFVTSYLIRDALGNELGESVRLDIEDVVLPPPLLIEGIANTGDALDPSTRAYLDRSGNHNGQYDIGDLRAYLVRTRQVR